MGPGVGPRGGLGGLPTPLLVLCGFLVFLYLVHNLPQLCMHAVIFSPLQFLCILLLKERFVQVQALQQKVPGPSLSHVHSLTLPLTSNVTSY